MTRARATRGARTTIGALVCVVVALAGCTTGDAGGAEPTASAGVRDIASLQELEVPDEAVPAKAQVENMNLLGGTATLPVVVAGSRTEPRSEARLAVWTTKRGAKLKDDPLLLETAGPPTTVDLAGSTELAALAGYSWDGTGYEPFVLTSTDRTSWNPVEVPAAFSGLRLTQAAVDGSTVYVFGTNADHRLVAAKVADGTLTPVEIPELDRVAGITAASASGGSVLVTLDRDPGDDDRDVVLTSLDGGSTWERSALESGSNAVDAIVHPDGALLLLGSLYEEGEGATRRASWSTKDGTRWTPDKENGIIYEVLPEGDQRYGRGTAYGEHIIAPVVHERLDAFHTMIRPPGGHWGQLIPEDSRDGDTRDGEGTPVYRIGLDAQTSAMPEQVQQTLVSGRGAARLYDESDRPLGTLGDSQSWFTPNASGDRRPDALLSLERGMFESDDEGWRTSVKSAHAALEGDALRLADPDLPTDHTIVGAENDGTEVLLASGWTKDGESIEVSPWVSGDGAAWTAGKGFSSGGFSSADVVAHTGDRWLAAGQRAKSASDRHRQAAVWTSTDGRTWHNGGKLEDGTDGSGVGDICGLPAGAALVVGSVRQGGRDVPASWVSDGERWSRTVHDDVGASYAEQCVTTDDGASIIMSGGTQTKVLATQDGKSFEEAFATEPGSSLADVVPVGTGLVAAGWRDTDARTGPVLWVSADGAEWDWVPVPARSTSGASLHRIDGELVVSTGDAGGVQAWRVADAERLVEAAVGGESSPR